MNPDGSGITDLTRNPGVDNQLPEWSPDSREITYMTQRSGTVQDMTVSQALGIASILIQVALLVGCILLLVRRWKLPFGAITLIITLGGLLLSMLGDQYVLLLAALFTGLVADLLLRWFAPSREHPVHEVLLACGVPVVWSSLYFLTLSLTQGMAWSMPLWTGSIVLAGLVGLGLSFLLRPTLSKGEPV